MFKKKNKKVDIHEECWDLSYTFIRWLDEHLKVYKEDASKVIKMDFHKFEYNGEEVPFDYLLDKLIEMTSLFIEIQDEHWCDERLEGLKEDIMFIFNMIFWHLWW